jgi:hypothetical protein
MVRSSARRADQRLDRAPIALPSFFQSSHRCPRNMKMYGSIAPPSALWQTTGPEFDTTYGPASVELRPMPMQWRLVARSNRATARSAPLRTRATLGAHTLSPVSEAHDGSAGSASAPMVHLRRSRERATGTCTVPVLVAKAR